MNTKKIPKGWGGTPEEIRKFVKKAGVTGTVIIQIECTLCRNKFNPEEDSITHMCTKVFVKSGVNPCNHRGSTHIQPIASIEFKYHQCITCWMTWFCECEDCGKAMEITRKIRANDYERAPLWPSRIRCKCGTKIVRTIADCPVENGKGDLMWQRDCEVEYPHYHVKCDTCDTIYFIEPEDIEEHRFKPGEGVPSSLF